MKRRFVVCINEANAEHDKNFIQFLNENKLGYWHWLNNTWLIVDENDSFNANSIRDKVKVLFNNEHNLVIEINDQGDTWSGFGPNGEGKNMFSWIKRNWKK
jgi:hypothetical protein